MKKRKKSEKYSTFVQTENSAFEVYKKGAFFGGLVGGICGLILGKRIMLSILIGAVAGGYINNEINKEQPSNFNIKKFKTKTNGNNNAG
jgi:uncharacterized protein YcfJ